ncbi:hypothetical protein V2A60_008680 [Cordyceps javanica]
MSTASGATTNPGQAMQAMRQQIEAMTAQIQALQANNNGGGALTLPKFPKPEPFDGMKGDVRTFLTQAKAYLRVNTTIANSTAQILCIGNLLTGKAMEWWEPTLRDFLDNDTPDDETARIFRDYDNFEELLQTTFGDPDEIRTATRKLKALRQTGSAQHLIREFKRISAHLDWDDESMMEYLYDALREEVKARSSKSTTDSMLGDLNEMDVAIDKATSHAETKPMLADDEEDPRPMVFTQARWNSTQQTRKPSNATIAGNQDTWPTNAKLQRNHGSQ